VSNKYFEGLLKSLVVSATLGLVSATAASTTVADQLVQVPVQGMVTMVDLGAKQCIPCKMMAPIIEELENEYKNRAAIVFIDVWEDPDAARNYGIKLIPTQIFYDAKGNETYRHEGFLEKNAIITELTKLGVK
jgi:thioredoxin 1